MVCFTFMVLVSALFLKEKSPTDLHSGALDLKPNDADPSIDGSGLADPNFLGHSNGHLNCGLKTPILAGVKTPSPRTCLSIVPLSTEATMMVDLLTTGGNWDWGDVEETGGAEVGPFDAD